LTISSAFFAKDFARFTAAVRRSAMLAEADDLDADRRGSTLTALVE
jgi:hypothetical protein